MKQLKILLVEDEMIIAESMRITLEELGYSVVGMARDYDEAEALLQKTKPDLAILDINYEGEKDGIDLANYIRKNYDFPFIFSTSYSGQSIIDRAKETLPENYLIKPVNRNDLYAAIEVALAKAARPPEEEEVQLLPDSILIKDGNYYIRVTFRDILYLKSDNNYVELHTTGKKLLIRSSLSQMEEKLEQAGLYKVHRSYLVNLNKMDAVNGQSIIIAGTPIPISRAYRDDLLRRLNVH